MTHLDPLSEFAVLVLWVNFQTLDFESHTTILKAWKDPQNESKPYQNGPTKTETEKYDRQTSHQLGAR